MKEYLINFGIEFWHLLNEMSPYLLFGFLVAGILSVVISPESVEKHLGGNGIWPVIKASVFGVPLPLCSCGVIPVAAALRRHGASKGATTSFLLSTPETGVDSFLVTLSLMGPIFAIYRPVVAFAMGIFGGALVALFDHGGKGNIIQKKKCQDVCCSAEHTGKNKIFRAIHYGFYILPSDLAKSLFVGIIIAAIISTLVPQDFFSGILGGGIIAMLVMMAFGIPMYVCATASVPIAVALIEKGVSPGAALVFLITGPATNAATIATIWKIMGKRTAIIYVLTVAIVALVAGLSLDTIFSIKGVPAVAGMGHMMPHEMNIISSLVLIGVLCHSMFKKPTPEDIAEKDYGYLQTATLSVKGMTCSHCVDNVKNLLVNTDKVEYVDVNLKDGIAVVHGSDFDAHLLCDSIEKLGYDAKVTEIKMNEEIEKEIKNS